MARGIGMNDPALGVHQEHARTDVVEGRRQGFGLGRLALDEARNHHRAPQMRPQQLHALARRKVGEPVALVAEHAEHGDVRSRPLKRDVHAVDKLLRLGPFLVEPRLGKLAVRHDPLCRDRFADLGEIMRRARWVELDELAEIEVDIMLGDAAVVVEDAA